MLKAKIETQPPAIDWANEMKKLLAIISLAVLAPLGTISAQEDFSDYVENAHSSMMERLEREANDGSLDAQMQLGHLLTEGGIVGPTNEELRDGVSWYRRAAEQDHIPAQIIMVDYALNGKLKAPDNAEAFYWLNRAANAGSAEAQYHAANMNYSGMGTAENYAEGERLLRMSAAQNYPEAQHALGNLYLTGTAMEKNSVMAGALFQKAAEQGYAPSQFILGNMLVTGDGMEKQPDQGVAMIMRSAEQGYEPAVKLLNRAE